MRKNSKKSFGRRLLVVSILVLPLLGTFAFLYLNDVDPYLFVNIAVRKNNKTYLYSKTGTHLVTEALSQGNAPSTYSFLKVYFKNDALFIVPNQSTDLGEIICGNYVIHASQEKTHDGYFTLGWPLQTEVGHIHRNTDKIGQQIEVFHWALCPSKKGTPFNIEYQLNPESQKSEKYINCESQRFLMSSTTVPGETQFGFRDVTVIRLSDLEGFYDVVEKIHLDKTQKLLYIELK